MRPCWHQRERVERARSDDKYEVAPVDGIARVEGQAGNVQFQASPAHIVGADNELKIARVTTPPTLAPVLRITAR